MERPGIGLALGAGVARGWAHIGVLDVLDKAGIEADIISGTSIGAVVGGAHFANKLKQLEKWALSLNRLRMLRYLDVGLIGGGLLSGARLHKVLRENLGSLRIEDLPKRFVPVCTELSTGHEIWVREGDLVDGIRASYALPGVFAPVDWQGFDLVDGALVNPVPTSVCRAFGARLVIAIDLNADLVGKSQHLAATGRSDEDKPPNRDRRRRGWSSPLSFLAGRKDDPSVFDVMVTSLNILQDRVARARMAGDPPDVYVAPKVGHIGFLEFDRAEEAITAGAEAMSAALPDLRNAMTVLGL